MQPKLLPKQNKVELNDQKSEALVLEGEECCTLCSRFAWEGGIDIETIRCQNKDCKKPMMHFACAVGRLQFMLAGYRMEERIEQFQKRRWSFRCFCCCAILPNDVRKRLGKAAWPDWKEWKARHDAHRERFEAQLSHPSRKRMLEKDAAARDEQSKKRRTDEP